MEGIRAGVNWKLFGAQFASWVVTMFVCGGVTAALFAQGVYTPSKIDGAQVAAYQKGLMQMSNTTSTAFNKTLYSYQDASAAGVIPGLDTEKFDAYSKDVAKVQKQLKNWKNVSQPQSTSIKPADVFKTYKAAAGLTANNTVDTLGQTTVYPGAQLCNGPSLEDIQANTRAECKAPTW
jgi:sodium-dependent phosphate transporter